MNNLYVTKEHYAKLIQLAKRANIEDFEPSIYSFIAQKPYCFVAVELYNGALFFGFSKCSPRDTWDPFVGFSIAVARALRKASKGPNND